MHPRVLYVGAAFIFYCFYCLLVAPASAQTSPQVPVKDPFYLPNGPGPIPTYTTQGSSLVVTVYRDRGVLLDRQAVVKLYNKNDKIASWHTTQMSSTAAIGNLTIAPYEVEVSAVGYLTGHDELNVQTELRTYRVDIILQHDPDSIELNQPGAEKIPSRARKDINRAVTDLKSGDLKDAQKRLDAAYKIVPSNSDINFLLGYLYFQKSQFQDAENYLVNATKGDPHHVQALTLLGRLRILREDYKGSSEVLEQALAAEPENWTAHNLLADAYLRLQEFEKARQQAQLAIETAKGAGNAARIPLAEALASLGRNPEALEALAAFLQNAPQSPIAPQVRDLMAEIKRRESDPIDNSQNSSTPTAHLAPAHLLVAKDSDFSIKSWEPPGIDEVRPSVATGVVCPYEKVIEETGKRMAQFVDDVAQFSAIEDVLHEDLDELGKPITKKSIQFDYVASISADYPGFLGVDEYRNDRNDEAGVGEFPDQIATRGLPALALVFHPDMRGNFQIVCEGLGEWNRQATWLLHFRQRDDRPNRIKQYKIGDRTYPANLKGRAWVSTTTFQIVRIESDLVSPMPQIQLLGEHQIVDYGPVPFPTRNVELWLPQRAELYFDFRRHHYFRRHSFDHFMLFAVDSIGKVNGPKRKEAQRSSTSSSTQDP